MEIKIEKYVYKRMADIYIRRIDCTEANILKVLDLFSWQNVIAVIGDLQKKDALFEKIMHLNLKYTTSPEGKNSCFDVAIIANIEQFKELTKCIFQSDSEGFAVINTKNENQYELEQYLHSKIPIRRLIKQGEVDLSIGIAIQEATIGITLSKECYNASMLAQKTKEIKKIF